MRDTWYQSKGGIYRDFWRKNVEVTVELGNGWDIKVDLKSVHWYYMCIFHGV